MSRADTLRRKCRPLDTHAQTLNGGSRELRESPGLSTTCGSSWQGIQGSGCVRTEATGRCRRGAARDWVDEGVPPSGQSSGEIWTNLAPASRKVLICFWRVGRVDTPTSFGAPVGKAAVTTKVGLDFPPGAGFGFGSSLGSLSRSLAIAVTVFGDATPVLGRPCLA